MNWTVEDKLVQYWANSMVASYIFCDDINSKLEHYDITKKKFFLGLVSKFVEDNKKFEILSEIANNNCKILINRFRFLETTSSSDKERCNELLILLNSSGSINSQTYYKQLFINSSFDEKQTIRYLKDKIVEDTVLEMLFDTCCKVVSLLLEKDEQRQVEKIYKLSNNEFYFYCLMDLIRLIPEILNEDKYKSSLYAVLEVNSKRMKKNNLDPDVGLKNVKIKKILKKELKSSN